MMQGKAIRSWCGLYQWPSKKEFLVGTVTLSADAGFHSIEAAVEAELVRLLREILPDDVPLPQLIGLRSGALWFVPDEERAAA